MEGAAGEPCASFPVSRGVASGALCVRGHEGAAYPGSGYQPLGMTGQSGPARGGLADKRGLERGRRFTRQGPSQSSATLDARGVGSAQHGCSRCRACRRAYPRAPLVRLPPLR